MCKKRLCSSTSARRDARTVVPSAVTLLRAPCEPKTPCVLQMWWKWIQLSCVRRSRKMHRLLHASQTFKRSRCFHHGNGVRNKKSLDCWNSWSVAPIKNTQVQLGLGPKDWKKIMNRLLKIIQNLSCVLLIDHDVSAYIDSHIKWGLAIFIFIFQCMKLLPI